MKTYPTLYMVTPRNEIKIYEVSYREKDVKYTSGIQGENLRDIIRSYGTEKEAKAAAERNWERRLKAGYQEDLIKKKRLSSSEEFMQTTQLADNQEKLSYPCYVQPKYQGLRCRAIISLSGCILIDYTGEDISDELPYLTSCLGKLGSFVDLTLDGVISVKGLNSDEVKKLLLAPNLSTPVVNFVILDLIDYNLPIDERISIIKNLTLTSYIKVVQTLVCSNLGDILVASASFKKHGFKSYIIKNSLSYYTPGKSVDILENQLHQEDMFLITGVDTYATDLQVTNGLVCETDDSREFLVPLTKSIQRVAPNDKLEVWIGKLLQVRFQGYSEKGVPIMPVGFGIRNEPSKQKIIDENKT